MTRANRILVLVASLALALVYLLPIWVIDLEAPQYPEGLGMVIRIDDIVGQKPNDLNNINNLNHYIGMKRIEPDSIPELVIMPWLVGLLMAGGLLTAAVGHRRLLYGWVGTYLLVSVVGLADFYKWEYDYGHNLDEENAIIKVPGMNYQPPLIGSKQLLNFRAHSWPGAGGWILIGVSVVGMGVAVSERRRARGARRDGRSPSAPALRLVGLGLVGATTLAAAACGAPGPRPARIGEDTCTRCLMNVMDENSVAEAVTSTGVVHVFDSIECMAAWLEGDGSDLSIHSVWVTDRAHPGRFIPAEGAHYLASDGLPSPMGLGLSAWAEAPDRAAARDEHGGAALDWAGVRAFVAQRWPDGATGMGMGHGGHGQEIRP